ncbi:MAG: hypothetical protein ACRD3S_05190, partial [Terracidiphilus sp.]
PEYDPELAGPTTIPLEWEDLFSAFLPVLTRVAPYCRYSLAFRGKVRNSVEQQVKETMFV